MISVGHENYVNGDKILAVVDPESAPSKRLRRESAEKGLLIDATSGRRTRSILIMNSHHIVLCPVSPSTLSTRLNSLNVGKNQHRKLKSGLPDQAHNLSETDTED